MTTVLISVGVLLVLAIVFGFGLGIADKKFGVPVDERVTAVREYLPGANCGGCGFAGCDGLAAAIVEGTASPSNCAPCSDENKAKIAEIMGQTLDTSDKKVARLICLGNCENCGTIGNYVGMKDCRAAAGVGGGFKTCRTACLGLGTCEKVCAFNAIKVSDKGIAEINNAKCTACGQCIESCPIGCLTLAPEKAQTYVACRNTHGGKQVISECKVGCIGCGKCVKACPFEAISMVNGVAVIDYEKCRQCNACADACPRGVIVKAPEVKAEIDPEKCVGCTRCKKECPFEAITGEIKVKHTVDAEKCRGCGACADVCKPGAITLK